MGLAAKAVIASAGLEDTAKGYSAMLHFQTPAVVAYGQQLSRLPGNLPQNVARPQPPAPHATTFNVSVRRNQ